MKKIIVLLCIVCILFGIFACASPVTNSEKDVQSITITDMAGRQHTISKDIDTVFATNPVGMVLLYTLCPQKLAGFNYEFNDYELDYIKEEYRDLPVLGTIATVNPEALIEKQVDIIINAGPLSESMQEKMDDFQQKLGIPIIMVDESLENTEQVYTFLGEILNEQEKAEQLSTYAKTVLDGIIEMQNGPTIYFGNGISSLDTSSINSPPSQVFDLIGAQNVCDFDTGSPDRVEVSAEHVIAWDPEYIFVNGEPTQDLSATNAAQAMMDDPKYKDLSAIKNQNIICIPKAPFSWLDRPRSANRLIGITWAFSILDPQNHTFTNDDIKGFYQLFYGLDLSDEQIDILLFK